MNKYINHESAISEIAAMRDSDSSREMLVALDLGRAYGRFCEREDIVNSLEESRERTNKIIQHGGLVGADLAGKVAIYKVLGNVIDKINGERQ